MHMEMDDSYIDNMGLLFESRGCDLNEAFDAYLSILRDVADLAVISGTLSDALMKFGVFAGEISGVIREISEFARMKLKDYLQELDEIDHYG